MLDAKIAEKVIVLNVMGYRYKGSIHTDYPFFYRMGLELGGRLRRDNFNGNEIYVDCQCPKCGKKEGALYASRRGDTYLFKCPREKCSLKAKTLHSLIKEFGPTGMFDEWRKARWEATYTEDWLPIKR